MNYNTFLDDRTKQLEIEIDADEGKPFPLSQSADICENLKKIAEYYTQASKEYFSNKITLSLIYDDIQLAMYDKYVIEKHLQNICKLNTLVKQEVQFEFSD